MTLYVTQGLSAQSSTSVSSKKLTCIRIRIRQHTSALSAQSSTSVSSKKFTCIRIRMSIHMSIRQHLSAYVGMLMKKLQRVLIHIHIYYAYTHTTTIHMHYCHTYTTDMRTSYYYSTWKYYAVSSYYYCICVLTYYDVSSYYYCHFTTWKKLTWKLLLESRKIIECLVRIHFRTYTPPPWMRINQHTSASACIRTSPRPECGHIHSSTMTRT